MIKVRTILVSKILAHVNWLCSKIQKVCYIVITFTVFVFGHIVIRCKAVQLLIDAMLMK